jgi:hypothetical protein
MAAIDGGGSGQRRLGAAAASGGRPAQGATEDRRRGAGRGPAACGRPGSGSAGAAGSGGTTGGGKAGRRGRVQGRQKEPEKKGRGPF